MKPTYAWLHDNYTIRHPNCSYGTWSFCSRWRVEVEAAVRAFVAYNKLVFLLPPRLDIKEFYLCLLLGSAEPFICHICAQVDQWWSSRSGFSHGVNITSRRRCGNEGYLNLFVTAPFSRNNDFIPQLLCPDIELSRRVEGGGNRELEERDGNREKWR